MNIDGLRNTTSMSKELQVNFVYKRKRRRIVEHDRLSSLPDDLIHKILSSMDIKRVAQTSVLSSRWRFVWTSTPYLNFTTEDEVFIQLEKFTDMVKHVLSGRNNEIDVYSVKLHFRGKVSHAFVKRIIFYAFSHNVQEMTITCLGKNIEFPLNLMNSQSLKQFTLRGSCCNYSRVYGYSRSMTLKSTLELPFLTTLQIDQVTFYDDSSDTYLSKCVNLKNLTLDHCKMLGSSGFTVCHPQLLNLTLKFSMGVVKVIAPQLKNISLFLSESKHDSFPCFSNGLSSLEKVDICIYYPNEALRIFNMLQHFSSVKYLTMNMETAEFLSSKMDLISNQPSPFTNLETLKIYPEMEMLKRKRSKISAKFKSYLLDSSPSAIFTMVSREEVKAAKNATLALKCIPKVQVLLDEMKTDLDKGKTITESHKENMHEDDVKGKTKVEDKTGTMEQIQGCWEDMRHRISCEEDKVSRLFSELKYIEELMTEISESKKVKIQARFAAMCKEADIIMKKLLERKKIECDMKQNHLSAYFHRLDKALQPSS